MALAQTRFRLPLFSLLCILAILLSNLLRSEIAKIQIQHHNAVFSLQQTWTHLSPWIIVAIYATTLFSTVLPIKVWNSNRNEKRLEQQQLRLNEAKLAALSRQINPHFLFNTLNSVTSLIRQDPEQARQMVYKLSKILGACCGSRKPDSSGENCLYRRLSGDRSGTIWRWLRGERYRSGNLGSAGAEHAASADRRE